MPELPEVETIKNQLIPCITDKKVLSSKIYFPKLRYPISVPPNNTIIKSLVRRSKYIICQCLEENQSIYYWILHLGMTGYFQFLPNKKNNMELPKHAHVDLFFDDGILRYIDPRRFGAMLYTKEKNHNLLENLGIEPLDINYIDLAMYLYNKSKNKKQNIKLFLTNNNIIVGIGNIYACEVLFETNISPLTNCNTISLEKYTQLSKNIQHILNNAIKLGGSTIDNFTHVHTLDELEKKENGSFQIQHKVYAKENKKCVNCDTLIKRIIQGQRSTFYCQSCQI